MRFSAKVTEEKRGVTIDISATKGSVKVFITPEKEGIISCLEVKEKCRGCGFGRILLAKAESVCRTRKCKVLSMLVRRDRWIYDWMIRRGYGKASASWLFEHEDWLSKPVLDKNYNYSIS
jgi:GNAT superfamily N-acetyltransferase